MNKRTEQTRWTPKRLLSLLMALIMTLSLLPTAAFADDGDDTITFYLENFKTASEEAGSEGLAAFGNIGNSNTPYRLYVYINPTPETPYMPGQRVSVRATAELQLADGVKVNRAEPLKVSIGNKTVYQQDSDSSTATVYNDCTIAQDGSISFDAKITYSIIESEGTVSGSRTIRVVIKNLWTGYNVTYSKPNDASFIGDIPSDGKTKTVTVKNADTGEFEQEYTIPDNAKASRDGCTFEGWTVSIAGLLSYDTQPGATLKGVTGDVTLTALLPENQEITFDPVYSGVSGLPYLLTATSTGSTYNIPYTPQLANYTFAGWSVTGGNAKIDTIDPSKVIGIDTPITLTPKWVPADGTTPVGSHKVTFHENAAGVYNMPAPQTVKHDGTAVTPITPQRDGYTFDGWYTEPTCTTKWNLTTDTVTTDLELYAKWTATPVTVTFLRAGSLPDDVELKFHSSGESISSSVGGIVYFNVTVPDKYDAAKMVVTAGVGADDHQYLVPGLQQTDASGNVTFYYRFTVKEGMTYDDKVTGKTLSVRVSNVSEKTFTVMMPTGHFNAEITGATPAPPVPPATGVGSTVADDKKSASIVYGGGYTFTVTPDKGYTVKRVAVNGATINKNNDGSYTVPDVTTAQMVEVVVDELPVYIVIYNSNNSQYAFQRVTEGSKATLPADPVVEGYTFGGWYTKQNGEGEQFTDATAITGDITVYAKLTANTYRISYNANTTDTVTNMPSAAQSKTHGLAEKLSETVPTREGYTFLGWGTTDKATAASYQPGDMYSVDGDITLYAVWEINKYTVTLPGGAGYTTAPTGTNSVDWGSNFTFTVIVDREYAAKEPTVKYSTDGGMNWTVTDGAGAVSNNSAATWTYTIQNVKTNCIVSIDVARNTTYTVSFITATLDNGTVTAGDAFLKQSVEHGYYAPTPAAPEREGFKFLGYYAKNDTAAGTIAGYESFPFEQQILKDTDIYAIYAPIKPVITWPLAAEQVGYTIVVKGTKTGEAAESELTIGDKVAYGSKVTFTITVADGYDASKMQVGVNGILYAPNEKNGNVYTFEFTAKEDTKITVTGIERKTVTVIYNANARDDVSGMPEAQTVKYYLDTPTAVNDTIIKQFPVRTGYKFLGWSKDSKADAADSDYTVEKIEAGTTAKFTENTTLYAVWEAQSTNVTLAITDVAYAPSAGRVIQYEGESITLQATLNHFAVGSVTFYKSSTKEANKTNSTIVGSTSIEGTTATFRTTVGEYKTTAKDEYYWAEFTPNADEGYSGSTSGVMNVGIFSKALSWKITKGTSNVADNGNVLNVYEGDSATGTPITGNMVAGRTYTLEVKTASITGVETLNTKQPELGKDYKIVWQYTEVGKNDWKTDGEASDKATYLVTGDKSGYQFRAQIVPLGPDNGSLFVKAGKFENDALVNNQYDTCLYTKSTNTTVRQSTATALTITDAETESKDVWVNGDTPFTATGEHKAQFEGQKVTLTATVKDTTTGTPAVTTGHVNFYRKGATADTLLNASPIAVGTNGVATCEVEISKWTGGNVTDNKNEFYAVYLANATYDTSASWTATTGKLEAVYIKSAKLMTPIIESTLAGKLDDTNKTAAQATTYKYNLTELLAGVQHEFKLRQTGAEATTGDWSVVALDGRTVDATNYDIKWLKTTGSNEQEVDATGTNQIKVDENKVGDRYRVKLTGEGVFAGSEATSKDAVIGTKQNVTVTVEATDAITKTPETDVYQLNEITLTATVAAAKVADATMKPTGTVTFYYKDGENWVKLDSTTLADATDGSGSKIASIKTSELPVKAGDNTKQDVEITAVYEGNDTFNVSGNYNATNNTVSAGTTENGVKDDTVTVYSSVVFNCNDENKKQTTDGDKGIHISVSDGAFKTNETATLALSDIYTLDRELTDETLRNTIAKLNPTTDYIVQWQKLDGATSITSGDYGAAKNWTNIDGKTGTTLVLDKVEQNTAYRAVITVNDQPITKGSSTEVNQTIKGRQVYYSNVLMPTDTSMTVSVALNTSKIGAENTEGITEGETVTANVYLSGVVGAVPNANVTVKVTNDDAKGNGTAGEYKQILGNKNTVNGWNAFDWDTTGVTPGFYTLTVSATTNTGYAAKEITRSLIVRESSYTIVPSNTTVTYNGRTQGLEVALNGFGFKGTGINEAANKSWTVKYYVQKVEGLETGALVEPTQAGTYRAVITLPASAYWTEQRIETTFTIAPRSVSIADAIAQAKVYDGTTDVNIVEVMLNDAVTDQTTNGTGLPTNNVGIINGDSIYAVATEAKLSSANAGDNSFTISTIELRGDDAANYDWDGTAAYTEDIYVSRSQVYGETGTLKLKQGEQFPADQVIKMIDQSGREINLGTGSEDYTLTFYYHSDTEIKQTTDISKLGLYTVIARPNQSNYKSGVTMQFTVVETATVPTPAATPKASTLITISNTAELYGKSTGVTASTTNDAATTTIEYQSGSTGWTTTAPTSAGRYLVKVTASTGDVAYGIYTITKAHPSIGITAAEATYNSMPYTGATPDLTKATENPEHYLTYAGDVAIGYNVQKEGNVDEQAPVDVGTYTVTLHVNETANYTAHEISKSFTIAKKALTIKADSWQTTQYDAFPDMTAGYTGLAAETGDTTPDTSLRDVQIAPEYLYNPTNGKSNYNNDTLDQVGYVAIQPIDALSKNYAITYEKGQYTKQRTETNVDLDIHGLPQSSTGTNTVYYGDVIQLYPYGYYTTHANGSGIFDWSVTTAADFKGRVTIGKETGLLNVNGVGEFTVTLKRGVGEQQIKISVDVTAIQKEAKIALKNVDKVYTGASQTYAYEGNVTVHDELYRALPYFDASKVTRTSTDRIDVGSQITTAKVTGAWAYQSETYGGKFTINDNEATVAPVADAHIYGTTRTIPSPAYTSTEAAAISNVLTASQTDAYNRLDVHDGYEILVAGTENMNYNVKYTTDETAEDSAVTTYQDVVFTSKTDKYLNDATIYGETPNVLDWTLVNVIGTTRDSVDYADNLADFDLPTTFVEQDKDDCTGNKVTYKAANRTTDAADSSNIRYNQDKLEGPRTSEDTATDENYTLKFNTVENSGAANYKLTNDKTGNSETTTNALTANSKGFIPATGESNDVSGENFVEGSANIAQRPIKLEKAVTDAQLYWRLPQSQLYTALVNVLKAEENSVGRGLAKGHTIEDLDLSFTINGLPVDPESNDALNLLDGSATVIATVGDTNYKLEGDQFQFGIVLKKIQIEATYTTKTFTGFTVLIKVHNENGTITPLNDAKGLSYKIFKKTAGGIDKSTAYAEGTLTYQNRTASDDKGGLCGVFTATYPQLPLLNSGETYFIQMYEYGVELKTNS